MRNYEIRLEKLRKKIIPKNDSRVFSIDEVNSAISAIEEYNLETGKSVTIEEIMKRAQNIPELPDDALKELSYLLKQIFRTPDEKL